jgi:hypothetical protein
MSNSRKPRKTASRVAREDQGLASARDYQRRNPGAMVVFVAIPVEDERCCWCDCPDEAHMGKGLDYRCGGCPETATTVVRVLADKAGPDAAYPLCDRHGQDFAGHMNRTIGDVPTSVYRY